MIVLLSLDVQRCQRRTDEPLWLESVGHFDRDLKEGDGQGVMVQSIEE